MAWVGLHAMSTVGHLKCRVLRMSCQQTEHLPWSELNCLRNCQRQTVAKSKKTDNDHSEKRKLRLLADSVYVDASKVTTHLFHKQHTVVIETGHTTPKCTSIVDPNLTVIHYHNCVCCIQTPTTMIVFGSSNRQ